MSIPCRELIRYMDSIADPSLAESFDNCGLQIGDYDARVESVLLALEVTPNVVDYAVEHHFDFIIVHHPLILNPLKQVVMQDCTGELLLRLAKNSIGVFTAHTDLDHSPGGTGDSLCALLGYTPEPVGPGSPFGRIVELPNPLMPRELSAEISQKLQAPVRLSIAENKPVHRLCVATGSGGSALGWAKERGAEAFLTGELKYHVCQECIQMGMTALEAGHYETEFPAMRRVYEGLQNYVNRLQCKVRIELYTCSTSPYTA